MKASDRIVNIIEDHALICHFLDSVVCALENGTELPNFVPVLNDTLITDHLSTITERLKGLKNGQDSYRS